MNLLNAPKTQKDKGLRYHTNIIFVWKPQGHAPVLLLKASFDNEDPTETWLLELQAKNGQHENNYDKKSLFDSINNFVPTFKCRSKMKPLSDSDIDKPIWTQTLKNKFRRICKTVQQLDSRTR